MSRSDVTVVIPTIPSRSAMLYEAMLSVFAQSYPCLLSIALDRYGQGAAVTRNKALMNVRTKYTAFLDDDDILMPDHVSTLVHEAIQTGADLVYSGARVINSHFQEMDIGDWQRFGKPFDADQLKLGNYIPVTALVRTKLAQDVGGFENCPDYVNGMGDPCEDWQLWLKMLEAGAQVNHVPLVTWIYRRFGQNTGGRHVR